jgi:hypothetical protein
MCGPTVGHGVEPRVGCETYMIPGVDDGNVTRATPSTAGFAGPVATRGTFFGGKKRAR